MKQIVNATLWEKIKLIGGLIIIFLLCSNYVETAYIDACELLMWSMPVVAIVLIDISFQNRKINHTFKA